MLFSRPHFSEQAPKTPEQSPSQHRNFVITDEQGEIMHWSSCSVCGDDYPAERAALGYTTCKPCGEQQAREARRSWCVLTPHKQGAMFFTADAAREVAIGINNKQQR
jgi:hypothetical protein